MVGINFSRPVGPYSDTKELEYISALLQTAEDLRPDGTVDALDIMHFLSSRHGVRVSEEIVTDAIVLELAGSFPPAPNEDTFMDETARTLDARRGSSGASSELEAEQEGLVPKPDGEEEDEPPPTPKIDICQLLALLLIPFLRLGEHEGGLGMSLSMSKQRNRRQHSSPDEDRGDQELVDQVVRIALNNLLSELDLDPKLHKEPLKDGVWLTIDLLREMLETFGEFNLPTSLLEEMMDVAAKGSDMGMDDQDVGKRPSQVYFDRNVFLHVLTADTQLYDPYNIDTKKSTHHEDARKAQEHQQTTLYGRLGTQRANNLQQEPRKRNTIIKRNHHLENNTNALEFEEIYTAANIDNNADTYRSTGWFTLVWVEAVLLYFAYLVNTDWDVDLENCNNEYGCAIAASLINWLVIFLELASMGLCWVFVATLGNATNPTEECSQKIFTSLRLLVGIAIVASVSILTFFSEDESYFWDTEKDEMHEPAYWAAFIGGCMIVGFQLLRLVGLYIDLGAIGKSGMEKKERCIKMAAASKLRRIVEHATLLHDNQYHEGSSLIHSSVSPTVVESVRSSMKSSYLMDKKEQEKGSTIPKALMGYHKLQDAKENVGGIFWAYQRLWDGSLFYDEGIYLHGRLIAVNVTQFFICAVMVALFFVYLGEIEDFLEDEDDHCTLRVEELNSPTPLVDLDFNETTSDGFANVFNVNSTHFSPDDGYTYVEGQFPKYNGTHFNTPNYDGTVCYLTQVAGVEKTPHGPPNTNETNATGFDFFNDTDFGFGPPEGDGGSPMGEGGPPEGEVATGNEAVDSAIGALESFFTGETTTTDPLAGGDQGGSPPPGPPEGEMDMGGMFSFDFANGTAFEAPSISTRLVINPGATHNEWLEMLEIEEWEYKMALSVGLLGAFLGTLAIALSYIPSFVSSVLKMRSGVLPSLKGDQITYLRFRKSPDQTAILFGINFWGCFFTAAACFLLFGLVTFVCVYAKTREYIIAISSAFIGMGATIGIKVIVMIFLRSSFYSGYYRKKPAASNIMNVVLECWSLGLSVGTVTSRMIQLMVVTAFYVGRIDTPMLAPGVGNIAGAPLDPAPDAFKKDLLIHEAHRHPFIERLGLLCLLKLHNGKDFGTRAGAHWRLLFVLALLPWMRNYRVRPDLCLDAEEQKDIFVDELDDSPKVSGKRRSIFDRYDKVGPLIAQEQENKRNHRYDIWMDNQRGVSPLEMEQALLVNARLLRQNRKLAALRDAREVMARANLSMDPKREQLHLQAMQAPAAATSIYCGVRLLSEKDPGKLVISESGLAYYAGSSEFATVTLAWEQIASNQRNSESSTKNLLRLVSNGGKRYDFVARSKADRASIRQEISARMEHSKHKQVA